jgi:hypothetical protein
MQHATRRGNRRQKKVKLSLKGMAELFKPARLEVYENLQIAGPSSIANLALRLGRPADSLYYHVKKLLAIGVIEERSEKGRERNGPGPKGAVYSVVARFLDVELNPKSRLSREVWAECGASVLRVGMRDFTKALESGDVRPEGARRNLVLQRVKARLNASQLKEVNGHLEALQELLCRHAENTKGDLHAITFLMTPLEERNQR